MTPEIRREKALRHFTTTFGEERGVPMWEAYCKKSGLLKVEKPEKDPVTGPKRTRRPPASKGGRK